MNSNLSLEIGRDGEIHKINLETLVEVRHKNGQWAVISPDLKTFGCSTTSEEHATQKFLDRVYNFFKFHVVHGSLDKALTSFHWQKSDGSYKGLLNDIEIPESEAKRITESFEFTNV